MNCIFCNIINKQADADIIYEDENFVAFHDIHPKAPFHILIVPRKHIQSLDQVDISEKELMGDMIFVAQKIAKEKHLAGYKLQINVGREGGQIVDHIHLHLLANKKE
ncbi:HIT domain-containing protein [Patescibacteria group bacterium]|nr:HIT domain-containing protein [Patescibacteria group bacterium]